MQHKSDPFLVSRKPRFREDKSAAMACSFVHRHGGKMSHLKLQKLMYIAERRAILGWGRSITFDRFVSMRHGPVLSGTMDLINHEPPPEGTSVFRQHIRTSGPYSVEAIGGAGASECSPLSPAEADLINEVYDEFGNWSKWKLRDHTHTFPEWEDPGGSSLPISIKRILERNGTPEPDILRILAELNELAHVESILSA